MVSKGKKKKRPIVNIDARVSKEIRKEKISKQKVKSPGGHSHKTLQKFINSKKHLRGKVVSDKEYEKLPDEKKFKSVPYTEAQRLYLEQKHDWFDRYRAIPGTETKKKITSIRIDRKTGEKKEVTRTRTVRRFRDSVTGRFISYKDVRKKRLEMRKEAAIYEMAQRKKISTADARRLYEDFEERGMDRYLLKEYAETP